MARIWSGETLCQSSDSWYQATLVRHKIMEIIDEIDWSWSQTIVTREKSGLWGGRTVTQSQYKFYQFWLVKFRLHSDLWTTIYISPPSWTVCTADGAAWAAGTGVQTWHCTPVHWTGHGWLATRWQVHNLTMSLHNVTILITVTGCVTSYWIQLDNRVTFWGVTCCCCSPISPSISYVHLQCLMSIPYVCENMFVWILLRHTNDKCSFECGQTFTQ